MFVAGDDFPARGRPTHGSDNAIVFGEIGLHLNTRGKLKENNLFKLLSLLKSYALHFGVIHWELCANSLNGNACLLTWLLKGLKLTL